MLHWLFCTTYGRIYLTAHLHRWHFRHTYTVIPRSAATNGIARDTTEYDAIRCWITGTIPNRNYNGRFARLPRRRTAVRSLNQYEQRQMKRFLQTPQKKHAECKGRDCIECKQNYPLTKEYWHSDNTQVGGFKTICKKCRNPVERVRIAMHRAAA
jgi:hypothetical protein